MSPRSLLSVVIPACNEEGAVAEVVKRTRATLRKARVPHEVIVVDDGSTDGTAQKARAAGAKVVPMGENRGYGASLKAGIRAARGDRFAMLDADGTYPPEVLPALLRDLEEADMVVGSRTGPGASVPLIRRPAKWLLKKWAEYLSERKIPDLNSGLRVFRKEPYERFQGLMPNRFSFTTTLTLALECHGYVVRYREVPYLPRVGKSKIDPLRDTVRFFSLVLRTVMYFKPLKIFLPLSAMLVLSGMGLGFAKLVTEQGISDATTLLVVSGLEVAALGLLADLMVKRNR